MAITLEVRPWCGDCGKFEADVSKYYYTSGGGYETVISCIHMPKCQVMANYLKEQLEKEKKDEEALR